MVIGLVSKSNSDDKFRVTIMCWTLDQIVSHSCHCRAVEHLVGV